MAVIARRTWAQLRSETILRLGNITAVGFSDRVGYFLWAAYQDLCLSYHHFELDAVDTSKTLSTSNNEVVLPTDCYIVATVRLKLVAGSIDRRLRVDSFHALAGEYRASSEKPSRYARWGSKLYTDTKPDAAYPLEIFYYRRPTAPDFSSGSPETDVEMDEHIMEGAIRKIFPAIGRPDLGDVKRQLLSEWETAQVRPALAVEPIKGVAERVETNRTAGGSQG